MPEQAQADTGMPHVPWPERTAWIQRWPEIGYICQVLLDRWDTWEQVMASPDGRRCVQHYLEARFGNEEEAR
ncbi:hypothetical protein [Nonomuraea sp. NPDC023979]|uniref:hypothetical protein n=1 Tax=Nonomuraea sp. NPDC023979 TaxID=3154796 RepID=UPI0033D6A5E8